MTVKKEVTNTNSDIKDLKSAAVTAVKLLRGLDNTTNKIIRTQNDLAEAIQKNTKDFDELHKIVTGISSMASGKVFNSLKQDKQERTTEMADNTVDKSINKVNDSKSKASADESGKKAQKRKPLKEAIKEYLTSKPFGMSSADIYKAALQEYGTVSRQSVYAALKDKLFEHRQNDGALIWILAAGSAAPTDQDETVNEETLKKSLEKAEVIANVV